MTQWEYTVQLRGNDVRQYYQGLERDPFRLPARPAKRFPVLSLARASARSWLAQWSPFPSPSILPDRSSPSKVTPR